MSEIKREDLQKFNYLMGLQIGALIQAIGMHWENQCYPDDIPYTEKNFKALFDSYSGALTHNGIMYEWQGA